MSDQMTEANLLSGRIKFEDRSCAVDELQLFIYE